MAALYLSTTFRNAACDAIVDLLDLGTIKFYTGTLPTTVPSDLSGYTLLGVATFGSPAFGAAASGTAAANAITGDTAANATGTCGWARIEKTDGTDAFDCDVTATGGGGTITVNTTSFVEGATISVTSFSVTMPAS
jgi:hypothetical protein